MDGGGGLSMYSMSGSKPAIGLDCFARELSWLVQLSCVNVTVSTAAVLAEVLPMPSSFM